MKSVFSELLIILDFISLLCSKSSPNFLNAPSPCQSWVITASGEKFSEAIGIKLSFRKIYSDFANFAESIIKIRENKNGIFNIILYDINEINEDDREYKINNEKSFIYIFICKVKYIFYKFKIRNGICQDTDLEELKDDKAIVSKKKTLIKNCIAIILKEKKCHFLEIKVYLLIAEWYL